MKVLSSFQNNTSSKKGLCRFLVLCFVLLFFIYNVSPVKAAWDGQSANNAGANTPTSAGYSIRHAGDNALKNICGYRFSIYNCGQSATRMGNSIDVFILANNQHNLGCSCNVNDFFGGDTIYRSTNKLSKFELRQYVDDATFSLSLSPASSSRDILESNGMFAQALPQDPSDMETWQANDSNIKAIASKMGIQSLHVGDKILIEPIYRIQIGGSRYALTITEVQFFVKYVYGADVVPKSSNTQNSLAYITSYLNKYFPSQLYTDKTHIGIAPGSKLSDLATPRRIITNGYGVGIYTVDSSRTALIEKYTITYYGNGGTNVPSQQTKSAGVDIRLSSAIPQKTDYTFTGWNTRSGGSGTDYSPGEIYKYDKNLSLYAQWEPTNAPYIYYHANTGTSTEDVTIENMPYPSDPNHSSKMSYYSSYNSYRFVVSTMEPIRHGYTFAGWANNPNGGTVYKAGSWHSSNSDVHLYAQWTANEYTITYHTNFDKYPAINPYDVVSNMPSNSTYTGTDVCIEPDNTPTRPYYDFYDWYLDPECTKYAYAGTGMTRHFNNPGNLDLYAKWVPAERLVIFVENTGSSELDAAVTNMPKNQTFTLPTAYLGDMEPQSNPELDGYIFNGWHWDPQNESPVNFTTLGPYSDNIYIYAHWTKIEEQITVTYHKNIENEVQNMPTPNPRVYYKDTLFNGKYCASVVIPESEPTCTGYKFEGWHTNPEGRGNPYGTGEPPYMMTGDRDIYAKWSPIEYYIAFNGNGATSGSMSNMTMKYDEAKNLTANNFVKDGYKFTGWNTKTDGSGTNYQDKQSVKNLATTNGATITLYAQWTPASYTVKYDLGDYPHYPVEASNGEPYNPQAKEHDVPLSLRGKPKVDWTGLTLYAWKDSDGDYYYIKSGDKYEKNKDTTMTAVWVAKIIYDPNTDGDFNYATNPTSSEVTNMPTSNNSCEYGMRQSLPDTSTIPNRPGYKFVGWAEESNAFPNLIIYPSGSSQSNTIRTTICYHALWIDAEKTSDVSPQKGVAPGEEIEYTIKVLAPLNCGTFVVTDPIPEGTEYISNSANLNGTYDSVNNKVVWTVEKPSTNECYTFTFKVKVLETTIKDNINNIHNKASIEIKNIFLATQLPTYYTNETNDKVISPLTVKYDANGGTGTVPIDNNYYSSGDTVTVLDKGDLARENYQFAGWNTKADGSGTHYNPANTFSITENTTLYAMWIKAEKKSSVSKNGCKPGDTITYTITVMLPENADKLTITDKIPDNTKYIGVPDTEDIIPAYNKSANTIIWTLENVKAGIEYKVNFEVTVNSGLEPDTEITNKATVTIGDNDYSYDTNTVTDVVAKYFTVKYLANGGQGNVPKDNNLYSSGDTVTVLDENTLAKDNYQFAGWNTKSDGRGTHYDPKNTFKITSDTVLYAMWLKADKQSSTIQSKCKPGDIITYTITVSVSEKVNTLTVIDKIPSYTTYKSDSATHAAKYESNTLYWTLDNPEIDKDYIFEFAVVVNGNAYAGAPIQNQATIKIGDNGYEYYTNPTTDIVQKCFTVTYNANGGTGTVPIDSNYYISGTIVTVLDKNTLAKDGYQFAGWNTQKGGSGTHFNPDDTFSITANTTLYAMWIKADKHSSTPANGCKPGDEIAYTIKVTLPEDAEALTITDRIPDGTTYVDGSASNNATFKNNVLTWTFGPVNKNTEYTVNFRVKVNKVDPGKEIKNTANITVEGNDYEYSVDTNTTIDKVVAYFTVKYLANGGTGTVPIDNNYYSSGDTVTVLDKGDLARENYQFAGWNTKADGSGTHYNPADTFSITENTTLYAMWIKAEKKSSVSENGCKPGDTITYTITVMLPENADKLTITDKIPDNTKYIGVPDTEDIIPAYNKVANTIIWTLENVKAGTEYKVNFEVIVNSGLEPDTEITNKATVTIGDNNYSYDTNTVTDVVAKYFTVKYHANGGQGNAPVDSKYYSPNEEVTVLDKGNLSRDGYQFAGWNTNADGSGTHYESEDAFKITNNTTLYAMWLKADKQSSAAQTGCKPGDEITYTITVAVPENVDSFTVTDKIPTGTTYKSNSASPAIVFENDSLSWTTNNPESGKDYIFKFTVTVNNNVDLGDKVTNQAGVLINNDGYDYSYQTNKTEDIIVNNAYIVVYDANTGTGNVPKDDNLYSSGETVTIKDKNTLKKDGYQFAGWNTTKEGNGTHYNPDDTFEIKNNTTLYAMWLKADKSSSVSDGGCKPGETITYTITVVSPEDADTLTITDKIPSGTTYVDKSASSEATFENNTLTWVFSNIKNGDKCTVSFAVTIKDELKSNTEINNTANIKIGDNSHAYDTNTVTNIVKYFTLTYHLNGGKYNNSDKDITVTVGADLPSSERTVKLIDCNWNDYYFIGWYLEASMSEQMDYCIGYVGNKGDSFEITKDINLWAYALQKESLLADVSIESIQNEMYVNKIYKGYDFIASAVVTNDSTIDFNGNRPLTVTLEVFDATNSENHMKYVEDEVVVPRENKNLVYFKIKIPTEWENDIATDANYCVCCGDEIPEGRMICFKWTVTLPQKGDTDATYSDTNEDNNKSTYHLKVSDFTSAINVPNTKFETNRPNTYDRNLFVSKFGKYINDNKLNYSNAFRWNIWTWDANNDKFTKEEYSTVNQNKGTLMLFPINAGGFKKVTNDNNVTARSGYELSIDLEFTYNMKNFSGNTLFATMAFPEYNYSEEKGITKAQTIKSNGESTTFSFSDVHYYTPMWLPDGEHIVVCRFSGLWTPLGEMDHIIRNSNTVTINGSLWDDYYDNHSEAKTTNLTSDS